MSLSNEMLKNLEERRASQRDFDRATADLSPPQKSRVRQHILIYLIVILSGLVILLAVLFFKYKVNIHPRPLEAQTKTIIVPNPILSTPRVIQKPKPMAVSMAETSIMHMPPSSAENVGETTVDIKTDSPPSLEDQIESQYQEALDLVSQNKITEAIQLLEEVIVAAPDAETARTTLATLLLQIDDNAEAAEVSKEGLALQPTNIKMTELYARALVNQNQPEQALQILLKNARGVSNNPDYTALLALVYERLNHFSEAANLYQKLLSQEPNNPRWLVGVAVSLEQMGDNNKALEAYEKARASNQLPHELLNFVINRIQALGG